MANRGPTRRWSIVAASSLVAALVPLAPGIEPDAAVAHEDSDHLASMPPMGWNSWNAFGNGQAGHQPPISEQVVKEIADRMVETGMRDAGYEYVVVDGGWRALTRDENGEMQADREFFPSGMKALGDYIHSEGLKFGLHQPVDETDCAGVTPGTGSAPGDTYAEKAQFDATTFAEWGVDYIKFDWCGEPDGRPDGMSIREWKQYTYGAMGDALEATGRGIVYSISEYGHADPWEWAADTGANLWRTTADVHPCWMRTGSSGAIGFVDAIDRNASTAPYAAPGHWNDPDMLVLGAARDFGASCTGGLTDTEGRAHFSMWAIMASPLMAGSDLRNDSAATLETLTNREVIAVNQDALGVQGSRVRDDGDQEVWVKPLANGDYAVALFNRGESPATITTSADEIGVDRRSSGYVLRDLWAHEDRFSADAISASVPSHGVTMFRVSPGDPEDAPPSTPLSVTAPDFVAGDPGEVTATLRNNGRTALEDLALTLEVPSGWAAEPEGSTHQTLPPGMSAEATWNVRPSNSAEPGSHELVAQADYTYGDDGQRAGVTVRDPVTLTPAATLTLAVPNDRSGSIDVVNCGDATCQSATPWLVAGESVSTTVTNYGQETLRDLEVNLQAPAGWSATATSPASFDAVPSGGSAEVTWQVTSGEGAEPGVAEFAGEVSYSYRDEAATARKGTDIRILVAVPPTDDAHLSDVDWTSALNQFGPVERDTANGGNVADDGTAITLNGVTYAKGLGVHAPSEIRYDLGGNCTRFTADVGVDDFVDGRNRGSVVFRILADGVQVYDSGVMREESATQTVDVSVEGADELRLVVNNAGNGNHSDHSDWADAHVSCGADGN